MQYLRFKPKGLWKLDTASPFADRSGYANNATATGSEIKGIALTPGTSYSHVVNSTHYITFPQSVYMVGREQQDFTLAASIFLPDVGSFTAQQILSNDGRTDGLAINGNVLTFSTSYDSTGDAVCTYVIPINKRLNVIGVHTATKNYLFVDGVQVDEIDITSEQMADTYDTTDGNLYAGKLANQNLLINNVAVFPRALRQDEVNLVYVDSQAVSETNPYTAYIGELIDVSLTTRTPYLNVVYESDDDWLHATGYSVFSDQGTLRPEVFNGVTVGGTWQDGISLYNGEDIDTIDSVNMYWTGLNVLVEASVDGTTWETVTPGVNLSSITVGFDPTDKALSLRATFTPGEDDAYLKDLQVRGYLGNTDQQPNGRIITFTAPAVTFADQAQAELRDNWGTKILGGTLTIGADVISTLPMTVKTIEIWIKQLGASSPTLSSNLTTGTTVYTNGVSGSTIRRGEWNIQHYTKSGGISGDLTFSGNVQIGRVVIYDSVLTSTQVSNVVSNYLGVLNAGRQDGGSLTIAEHSPPANIYAHDWATTS